MPDIQQGSTVNITHEVLVDGKVAFSQGEQVIVEQVLPNQQNPEYKYVVVSAKLGTKFQLSDADLVAMQAPQIQSQVPPEVPMSPPVPGPPAQPGPPQPPPQAPVPKKSSGAAKGCLIAAAIAGALVIIIIILLVVATGLGVHKAVKVVEKALEKNVVNVAIGQAGQSGPLAVKVDGWKPSPGDDFSKPGAGNQYVVVDLEIKNTGTSTRSVSTLAEMSIRTPNGYKYDLAPYFPDPKFPDGDILPGQTARGNAAFEVPATIGSMDFVFNPVLGDIIQVKLR
jgi:hypothetical protein